MTTPTVLLEEQMQDERNGRAQMALLRGEMSVLPLHGVPHESGTWAVASKSSRYTVSLEGDAWACTCPDFAGRCQRFGLRCKHIEAVRISEAGQDEILNTQTAIRFSYTEEHMTQPAPTTTMPFLEKSGQTYPGAPPGQEPLSTDEVIWRLRQPLDMSRVKRRQAPGQGTVPYLEGYDVIEVANDLFRFRWSFDLLSEPRIMRWDKTVTFYDQRVKKKVPVLGEDGKPTTEIVGVAYITGRVTVNLEGEAYCHADVGRCIFSGETPEALDMAIAGAATDCLKRCFRQLGEHFGNSLYDKEIAKTAGLENGASSNPVETRRSTQRGKASQEPATGTQAASTAPTTQPEVLLYRDGSAVFMNNVAEVSAFNAFKAAHQGLEPASREVLRAWSNVRNGKR